jgi:hypothetical protein
VSFQSNPFAENEQEILPVGRAMEDGLGLAQSVRQYIGKSNDKPFAEVRVRVDRKIPEIDCTDEKVVISVAINCMTRRHISLSTFYRVDLAALSDGFARDQSLTEHYPYSEFVEGKKIPSA